MMAHTEAEPPEIRSRPLAPEGTLAGDFVRGRAEAEALLKGRNAPSSSGAARFGPEAFRVTGPEAGRRLEAILEGKGRLVSTGQQPVLFGGPLYVAYKTLTAVAMAEHLEAATGEPALALFWVGSDDHDWAEGGGIRLLDLENSLREVRIRPPQGHEGRSVGPTPLPEHIDERIGEIAELLPETDFIEEYLELIRETHRPGRTLTEAFAGMLSRLVAPRRLAILDGVHPSVKAASGPFLAESLERSAEEAAAVEESSAAVQSAGYELQMPLIEGASHVFIDTGTRRERIYREGASARLGRKGREVPLQELLEDVQEDPSRFSPNVALRPVVESWLLPVDRVVLGPGELAYWAQLPDLFALRDVPMPAVEARCAWTVVEEKVGKVLRGLDAGPEAFRDGGEALKDRIVAESRPGGVEEALDELRADIGRALQRVEGAVGDELPGIRGSVGKARSRLFEAVAELEDAVDGQVEERQETRLSQLRKAAVHLFPGGVPQERVLSPLYYLARYDGAFLEAVDRETRNHLGLADGGEGGEE